MKKTILGLFLISSFTTTAMANTQLTCPDIEAIAKVNFDYTEYNDVFNKWYVMQRNHAYDQSKVRWDFGIIIDAKNKEDAIVKARHALTQLRNPSAPKATGGGYYMCEYTRETGTEGVAFYPAGNSQNINYLKSLSK